MLFTDPNQIAIVVLVLIVGLVLGLMLAPRGTKWRTRYEAERDAHAAYRTDTDAKMRALRTLGVPYTDEDIAGARDAVKGKTEMDALVAYLQVLGTAIKNKR